jgi:hypothetical protein
MDNTHTHQHVAMEKERTTGTITSKTILVTSKLVHLTLEKISTMEIRN